MCTVTSLPLLSLPSGDYLTSSRLSENIELLIKMWLVKIYLASNSNPHYKDINAQCMALSEYKNYILWKLVSVVIQRGEHFRTFWALNYAWNINTCFTGTDLFDGPNNFKLSRGMEIVSLFPQKQSEVSGDVSASNIWPHYAVWHGKALINWDCVCYTVSRI